jgi:hypothetical protein
MTPNRSSRLSELASAATLVNVSGSNMFDLFIDMTLMGGSGRLV